MRSKIVFLISLALAFQVRAVPVTQSQAASAARAWAAGSESFGAGVGGVGGVHAHSTTNGAVFYSVKMSGGGTVFTSGNTEIEPIIAFVAGNADYSELEEGSPLKALLHRDLSMRYQRSPSSGLAYAASPSAIAARDAAAGANAKAWAELLAADAAVPSDGRDKGTGRATISEVRVGPLMKSKWSQASGIWNYYTPKSYVCGCVATAAGQIMRYLHAPKGSGDTEGGMGIPFPKADLPQRTFTCQVDGQNKSLTMAGGTYAWDKMPRKPLEKSSDAEKQNIGKLVSDVGIAVCMSYAADGSGAYGRDVSCMLMDVFGYRQAIWIELDGASGITSSENAALRRVFFANFDAGYPLELSIPGHAIVADGYGYSGGVPYVHLNMGWASDDDIWYHLPDITDCGAAYTVINGASYNIFPTVGGVKGEKTTHAIISGRTLDDENEPFAGCRVSLKNAETGLEATNVVSSAKGIWSAILPAGRYDVTAVSEDGDWIGTLEAVSLTVPTTTRISSIGEGGYTGLKAATSSPGNSWGNDVKLIAPDVQIVVGDVTNIYSRLDKALAAAKEFYEADPTHAVMIEVLDDTELRTSFEVDFPCEIRSVGGVFTVTRGKGAKFTVAAGGAVGLSDIAFSEATSLLFDVAEQGNVRVGAGVSFGIPKTMAAIQTADAAGFTITAVPTEENRFSVLCTAAVDVDTVFGAADCDFATAQALAAQFVNLNDPNGEISGEAVDGGAAPYALKWSLLPVPLEDASAYYVVDDEPGVTNCFRRLDRLFEIFESVSSPAAVTIVKNGSLSRKVTPAGNLKVVSPNGVVISNLTSSTGFVITNGIQMSIAGVSFDGYGASQIEALFLVNGGELEIGGNVSIRNVKGANDVYSGVVSVLKGSATIGSATDTVEIEDCTNPHVRSCGGAVYLKGKGCALTVGDNVTIRGCNARADGGAVYLGYGAAATLAGSYMTITGNTVHADNPIADDIYCDRDAGEAHMLYLAGEMKGSRVGIRTYGLKLSSAGGEFAAVVPGLMDMATVEQAAKAFLSDVDSTLQAEPSADYGSLKWRPQSAGIRTVSPDAATACIVQPGGVYVGYTSVEDALEVLENGGTVVVMRDAELTREVQVNGAVTLKSEAGGSYVVTRSAASSQLKVGEGAALTIENLTLDGGSGSGQIINVASGALTLDEGAVVQNVRNASDGTVRSGAIKVYNGRLTMLDGSAIRDCINVDPFNAPSGGCGGAITADTFSFVSLQGGVISGCAANQGGAVFVANESTVEISGGFTAIDEDLSQAMSNNVCVAVDCSLVLAGKLDGYVGYLTGVGADKVMFGKVSPDYTASDAEVAESAHHFLRVQEVDVGVAVRRGKETLLVWSNGLDDQGNYVNANGEVYAPVPGSPLPAKVPHALEGLVYAGVEQDGVSVGCGYAIVGDRAKDAGTYEATLTIKAGFVWEDEWPLADRKIAWKIAPATLFVTADPKTKEQGTQDPALTYSVEGLQGSDTCDQVLVGELGRAAGEEIGEYDITNATLRVVGTNYTLDFTGALFTITEPSPGPGPGPGPQPTTIEPLAFASIEKVGSEWVLVATNVTTGCEYSLRSGTTLNTSEWEETAWTLWTAPTGAITNRVPVVDGESQRFWLILERVVDTQVQ